MMISNLIIFTMNCNTFSKNILFCCGKGCQAKSPSLRPQKVDNYANRYDRVIIMITI